MPELTFKVWPRAGLGSLKLDRARRGEVGRGGWEWTLGCGFKKLV